jgi:hypothetical protein
MIFNRTFRGRYRSPEIINRLSTAPYHNLPLHFVATDTLLTNCHNSHTEIFCNLANYPSTPQFSRRHRPYSPYPAANLWALQASKRALMGPCGRFDCWALAGPCGALSEFCILSHEIYNLLLKFSDGAITSITVG